MLYSELPENYKYCMECMAFTPHNHIDNDFDNFECCVCHTVIKSYDMTCDYCGYVFNEDDLYGPDSYTITQHNEGCHFGSPRLAPNDDVVDYAISCLYDSDELYADWLLRQFVNNMRPKDLHKLRPHIKYQESISCGCPKITVYCDTNRIEYKSWYIYSMDCSNAMEWDVTMRCPKCQGVSIFSDGNC